MKKTFSAQELAMAIRGAKILYTVQAVAAVVLWRYGFRKMAIVAVGLGVIWALMAGLAENDLGKLRVGEGEEEPPA